MNPYAMAPFQACPPGNVCCRAFIGTPKAL